MWEGKVFAAADADAADAAETDWKHKVTPERGDLMINFTLVQGMEKSLHTLFLRDVVEMLLKFGHVWVLTFHRLMWM